MESFDDFSLFPNEMDTDQQSMFDSIPQNDLTGFPNEYEFHPESSIDPIVSMEFDYNPYSDFNNQNNDFLSHEMPTHEFVPEFSQNHGLSNDYSLASFHEEQGSHHGDMHLGQTSFTGIYNDAEINRMKEDVDKYNYEVNHLNSDVHHHENLVDLSKGKSDYDYEVSQLNKVTSEYNDAASKLNDARSKLNNAT